MLTLAKLQSDFSQSLKQKKKLPSRLFRKTSPASRMGVYQYAFRARLEESLCDDFPLLRRKMGKRTFSKLILSFLEKTSLHYASVAELSACLPIFLLHHPISKKRPELPPIAHFEWAKILVYLTETPPPSNLGELSAPNPEGNIDFSQIVFKLAPSVRFFESVYDVTSKAKKLRKGKKTRLIIFQRHSRVVYRKLTPKQWLLIHAIAEGKSLTELPLAVAQMKMSDAEISAAFSQWTEKGILHSFRFKTIRKEWNV